MHLSTTKYYSSSLKKACDKNRDVGDSNIHKEKNWRDDSQNSEYFPRCWAIWSQTVRILKVIGESISEQTCLEVGKYDKTCFLLWNGGYLDVFLGKVFD